MLFWTELVALGRTNESAEPLEKLIELLDRRPNSEKSLQDWAKLAQAHFHLGHDQQALDAFEMNLKLRGETTPTNKLGPRWWFLTCLLARMGDLKRAQTYFDALNDEIASDPKMFVGSVVERLRHENAGKLGVALADLPLIASPTRTSAKNQRPAESFEPVISAPEYETGSGPIVRIDEGHGNFHTMHGRYRAFANVLQKDGYQVDPHDKRFSGESLDDVDILVIANARSKPGSSGTLSAFDANEIEALFTWVNTGGSLLLIADHAPFGSSVESLGKRFGLGITNAFATKPNLESHFHFSLNQGLIPHPITKGRNDSENIEGVATFTGQAFSAPADAEPLLTFGKDAELVVMKPGTRVEVIERRSAEGMLQGAVMSVGKGRLAVFGEAAMFTAESTAGDETRPIGLNSPLAPDNQQFLLNTIHWLSHRL